MAEITDTTNAPVGDEGQPKDTAQFMKLITEASLQYSLKNYNEAAELYSTATEIQSGLNGEMALENAELLFLYGRCLYKVAVSKSDVLGGQLATEKPKTSAAEVPALVGPSATEKLVEAAVEAKEEREEGKKGKGEDGIANRPYFEITGDDNWDTDSDEEGEGDAQAEAVEEEDDLANAYEILDIARVLLIRQIDALNDAPNESAEGKGKGKATGELSPELRHFKERLADTHDLQAEISLENERFDDAIVDTRSALTIWQELHPKATNIIAEGHYKLSLALEMASNVDQTKEEAEEGGADGDAPKRTPEESEKLKEESIQQMDAAIESCRLRLAKEEAELSTLRGEKAKAVAKSIDDVKEIIEDMEQRVLDLKNPALPDANPMADLLKGMLGESPAQAKARVDEQSKNANDLSGLVRKKKPEVEEGGAVGGASSAPNGKRKLDDGEGEESDGKKARLEG
ncbi:hypothetical protein EJ08DRAFT_624550 [Tothia fuscella]|uniref:Tetratricopeptide SHNi-TPR domain-containing protein n=1 Tax=Tothia fuscella TaxID=1048955 RepID=A0A9P4P3P2_9PEZI|nr:hypothetical protein EJ08DRAFT_624550 [Tothia fuscella]